MLVGGLAEHVHRAAHHQRQLGRVPGDDRLGLARIADHFDGLAGGLGELFNVGAGAKASGLAGDRGDYLGAIIGLKAPSEQCHQLSAVALARQGACQPDRRVQRMAKAFGTTAAGDQALVAGHGYRRATQVQTTDATRQVTQYEASTRGVFGQNVLIAAQASGLASARASNR